MNTLFIPSSRKEIIPTFSVILCAICWQALTSQGKHSIFPASGILVAHASWKNYLVFSCALPVCHVFPHNLTTYLNWLKFSSFKSTRGRWYKIRHYSNQYVFVCCIASLFLVFLAVCGLEPRASSMLVRFFWLSQNLQLTALNNFGTNQGTYIIECSTMENNVLKWGLYYRKPIHRTVCIQLSQGYRKELMNI